jgi:hypothetical protein
MFDIDNGIVSNSSEGLNYTLPIVVFLAVALYNVIELAILIFASFRNRHGLYFWSFCVATFGTVPYSLGFLLKGLGINTSDAVFVYVTLIVVGWTCLVTGQSVVLYSRLHLVDRNPTHLRCVLVMIIVNGIMCHVTIAVLIYGSNSSASNRFLLAYSIAEKVQVSIFFVQECIISGLYIAATIRFFRHSVLHPSSTRRKTLWHLISVNVIVILLDITILGLEYTGLYEVQTAYKAFVYTIKLKLEFSVLNKLMDLTRMRSVSNTSGGAMQETPPCPSCREDFIFDGSQQMHTCLEGTMALGRLDGKSVTLAPPRPRPGSITIAADPGFSRSGPPPARDALPSDGIMVMTTTSVNVTSEDELERQWQSLRRISSDREPHRGSVATASTMEPDQRKSASSSDAALTKVEV